MSVIRAFIVAVVAVVVGLASSACPPTPSVCGDGEVTGNEECDAGQTCLDGTPCTEDSDCAVPDCGGHGTDGCTDACVLDPGYVCFEEISFCTTAFVCGDGVFDNDFEECDDGNVIAGDGCSATCTTEPGFVCLGSTCIDDACGNGAFDDGEACDDGNNTRGDGCDSFCAVEERFVCTPAGPTAPSRCEFACGNGVIEPDEVCDDGSLCSDGATPCTPSTPCPVGQGSCAPRNRDGCNSDCVVVEPGFRCVGEPSVCTLVSCGDGGLDDGEFCDDGDVESGDGCSASCHVEGGFTCVGTPSVCTP